jgi:hypothetical protein
MLFSPLFYMMFWMKKVCYVGVLPELGDIQVAFGILS